MLNTEEMEHWLEGQRYCHGMRGLVGGIKTWMRDFAERMSREQYEQAREEWAAMEQASDRPLGFDWLCPWEEREEG